MPSCVLKCECSILQCIAVRCSVLQCVAVCCSVLQSSLMHTPVRAKMCDSERVRVRAQCERAQEKRRVLNCVQVWVCVLTGVWVWMRVLDLVGVVCACHRGGCYKHTFYGIESHRYAHTHTRTHIHTCTHTHTHIHKHTY